MFQSVNVMTVDEVRRLAEPVLVSHAVRPVEVVLRGDANNPVIEIFIDSEEGVTSGICTKVSRDISMFLEKTGFIRGKYNLVVSSPGIDRPLKLPQQYKRNLGRKLRVIFSSQTGQRTVEGTLEDCSHLGIVLSCSKEPSLHLTFDTIIEAKVTLPW